MSIVSFWTVSVHADPMSCDFNWDRTDGNMRFGTPATSTPRKAPSGRDNQGYVEDYGNRAFDDSCEWIAGGVSEHILREEGCVASSETELTSIHCSGVRGNGYFYAVENLNINQFNNYWDEASEELVFQTALGGVHDFAKCQEGIFNSYYGNADEHETLNKSAWESLNKIVDAYYKLEATKRDQDQRGVHTKRWYDAELNALVSRVPMGNRDGMRKALVDMIKMYAVRKPNSMFGEKYVPYEAFRQVYEKQMREMADQTEVSMKAIEGPKDKTGKQRTGGILRVRPDGQRNYCIDSELKTYLFRNGQVNTAVSQYHLKEPLTPGFMCRATNRYSRICSTTVEVALIPTYFTGYGLARLAVRAGASGFRAFNLASRALNVSSRMTMLGLEGADWITTAKAIHDDCNMEEMFANVNGKSCDPGQELNRVYQEASLSQCLTTTLLSSTTLFAGGGARNWYSKGLAKASGDSSTAIAKVADDVIEEVTEDVVVTGSRQTDRYLSSKDVDRVFDEMDKLDITPGKPLSPRAAVEASPNGRLYLVQEEAGITFTKDQGKQFRDLLKDGVTDVELQKLEKLLRSAGVKADNVDGVITTLVNRGIIPKPKAPATKPTAVRPQAMDDVEARRLSASLEAKEIKPDARLSDGDLAKLTSNERVLLVQRTAGVDLTPTEARQLIDLAVQANRTGWSNPQVARLQKILREAGVPNTDIVQVMTRIRSQRLLDLPPGVKTLEAPTPPRQTLGEPPASEKQLIEEYADVQITTREQNARYNAQAVSQRAEDDRLFVDLQNRELKGANDAIKNKPLIDALNNRRALMLEEGIHGLRDRYPTLKIETYWDYKGVRFAIDAPPGKKAEILAEIKRISEDLDARFLREVNSGAYPSVTAKFDDVNWYRTEVDDTADMANLLVRTGMTRVEVGDLWKSVRGQRKKLEEKFGASPLMRAVRGEVDAKIPTAEVFELLRREASDIEVAKILSHRHGMNVSPADVALFRAYAKDADQFSPNLRIDARVQHDFGPAEHGGGTMDFGGVGSLNAEATAEGLAQGFDLKRTIVAIRAREKEVTEYLDLVKAQTQEAVDKVLKKNGIEAKFTVSGDDLVFVPNKEIPPTVRDEILAAQAKAQSNLFFATGRNTNVRVSYFARGIDDVDSRAILAAEGESIEKILRKRLEYLIPHKEMKGVTIGTDMLGTKPGQGQVILRTNNLPPQQRAIIEREFRLAIEDANRANRTQFTPANGRLINAVPTSSSTRQASSALSAESRAAAKQSLEGKGITEKNYRSFFNSQDPVPLTDNERIFLFEHYAGIQLSAADAKKMISLHEIGDGYGTYTRAEIRAKREGIEQILASNGITDRERIRLISRDALDQGVLGSVPIWRSTPLPPRVEPPKGVPAPTELVSAEAYLNTKYLRRVSNETRQEITTDVSDFSQARAMVMRFPAFKDLGFGLPGKSWRPMRATMERSSLNGRIVGWEVDTPQGLAHVRLDWDEVNGAHYNIMIQPPNDRRRIKLAVRFACQGRPCTSQEVVNLSDHFQDLERLIPN